MATMNVSLPDAMREWIEAQVKTGRYANASDYMRDLVRRDQELNETLLAELDKGLKSGVSKRTVEDIWASAKAKSSSQSKNG